MNNYIEMKRAEAEKSRKRKKQKIMDKELIKILNNEDYDFSL